MNDGISIGVGTLIIMKYLILLLFGLVQVSCKTVGIVDQANLSKPIFQFQASGPQAMECSLGGQLEPGRASANGVAAGGCAFCH
jgi:hypothetical protein